MSIEIRRDTTHAMKHTVRIGNHTLTVDEPASEGGEDLGPNPHDLYDSALGACKALTVLWYARRKQIPVDDIHVTVHRDASQERSGTYRLDVDLGFTGELSEAQKAELLAVAEKCPVQKLMTKVTTEVHTRWVDPQAAGGAA